MTSNFLNNDLLVCHCIHCDDQAHLEIFYFNQGSHLTDFEKELDNAESLLNQSELIAKTTSVMDYRVVALIKAVRNRSDKSTSNTTSIFANYAELITFYLNERHIEFLGDGIRNADLMGLSLPIIPAKPIYTIPEAPISAPNHINPSSIDALNLIKRMVNN